MRKWSVMCATLLSVFVASTAEAQLPGWVSNLPFWQWYQIPNTALSSVAPNPPVHGFASAKIDAWCGATLKKQGSVYLIGAAGGHADYAGNEVDALALNVAVPQWVQLRSPTPDSQIINAAQYYLDLRPSATHTYYASQFINARNRLFVMPSPGMGDASALPPPPPGWPYAGDAGYTFSFNMATNDWDAPEFVDRRVAGGDFTACYVAKNPVTEDIYYNRYAAGWWKWTQATNTWTLVNNNNNFPPGNYQGAAVDPVRNRILSVGGGYPAQFRDFSGNSVPATFTGLGPSAINVDNYPGIIYDEANDNFLVFYNTGGTIAVRRVNAGTLFVDAPIITGAAPADRVNGVQNSVQYVPELGGIVMATTYSGNVYFMRTSAAAPPPPDTGPPTVSVSSPTAGTVSGSISVTAIANDDVGVVGVQFTLDGVNLGAEDLASPFSTTWNTVLTSNGSHTLRAIARDAVGNSTTSAPIVVTVSNVAPPPIGTLVHDGPVTPEQMSLYIPITGTIRADSAVVRYKITGSSTWAAAHPLARIRPQWAVGDNGPPDSGFASVITGLTPGVSYTAEVTTRLDDGTDNVQTVVSTTRQLPPDAGAPTSFIGNGSSTATIQAAWDALSPGNVCQIQNGTYNLTAPLIINRGGTPGSPIYIRGQSRTGVILSRNALSFILEFANASDVVLENLTIQGTGADDGVNSRCQGIRLDGNFVQNRITVRQVTVTGVDVGILSDGELDQILVYDCTFSGNNPWTRPFTESNLTWNDDGIRLPGFGNCGFNNTLSGFGDAFATYTAKSAGVHYYRNDVLWTDDDGYEEDHGYRNLTFYDNRIWNSMTFISCDPNNGGPFFAFRNISLNTGRSPIKLNNDDTGMFIYNNTIVATAKSDTLNNAWGWQQSDNGPLHYWGYRNNILIYRGPGRLAAIEPAGNDLIDFTNNAWYPNGAFWWTHSGGSFSTMAAARSGLPATEPAIGTSTQRHQGDVISEFDPFVTDITLGADYSTKVVTAYVPSLSNGTAPKNAGVAIPGITDGFTGAAPDMGAIISGLASVTYGDRGPAAPPPDTTTPSPPHNVRVR